MCFVDTSSLESVHKMVTALLPFLPKTSDANYTNLTTFDSVKREG